MHIKIWKETENKITKMPVKVLQFKLFKNIFKLFLIFLNSKVVVVGEE